MIGPSADSIPNSDSIITPSSKSGSTMAVVTPGSDVKDDDSPILNFVKEPNDNDVLCGRGGSINSHPGNERFRQLVEKRKRVYLTARFKREKRLIANSILSEIRSIDPPGRFLSRDPVTGSWYDIGDEKARDKTSQALRENAPSIRAEIEVEINQQRAEMQRVEDEEAAMAVSPPGPPHPYYRQPWGYYAPYHGYGQYHSEPPAQYGNDERYERQWHGQYPEGTHASPPSRSPSRVQSRNGNETSRSHYNEPLNHSAHAVPESGHPTGFDVPGFVSSVPSSIAAWTRTSFSFGGHSDHPEQNAVPPTPKPLPYVHDSPTHDPVDHRGGRRMVHFEDDGHPPSHHRPHPSQYGQRRYNQHAQHSNDYYGYVSPSDSGRDRQPQQPQRSSIYCSSNAASGNAKRKKVRNDHAIAPLAPDHYEDGEQQSSLFSQVTSHILGSWDTSMVCASGADETMLVGHGQIPPEDASIYSHNPPPVSLADAMEDEGGQEVELVDMMDFDEVNDMASVDDDIRDDERRMPPPDTDDNMPPPPRRIEIDWPSKMLGCQANWLPETFNPPSFFSKSNPLSPSASLDMDTSAIGIEGISINGSIGGASLCQVFSHDPLDDANLDSPTNEQQGLSHMPSWERSVRSKSPSTVCSEPSITDPSQDEFGLMQ